VEPVSRLRVFGNRIDLCTPPPEQPFAGHGPECDGQRGRQAKLRNDGAWGQASGCNARRRWKPCQHRRSGLCGYRRSNWPEHKPFGKDTGKRVRFFKGLRSMASPIEPLFSGQLSHMPIPG
jgi:hypothetical protein